MATKWKDFSRKRAVKVALVIVYIVCFGMVGMITGFAPANGYDKQEYYYCVDALFADSYMESASYAHKLTADHNAAQALFLEYEQVLRPKGKSTESDYYEQLASGIVTGGEFASDAVLADALSFSAERFCEELAKLPFYCEIKLKGVVISNAKPVNHRYRVSNFSDSEPYVSESIIPRQLQDMVYSTDMLIQTDDHFEIGYSAQQIATAERSWSIMRYNTQVIIWMSLVLVAFGIMLLVCICRVSGEAADGSASWSNLFILPYELSLAAAIAAAVGYVWVMLDLSEWTDLCLSANGRTFFMVICGATTALFAAAMLYMFMCMSIRRKNKKALRGSIVCCCIILCVKLLKLVLDMLKKIGGFLLKGLRFFKELFTGEHYRGATVARRLVALDAAFIAVSCLVFLFAVVTEVEELLVVELVFLAAFIYGRVLLVKDEAKLERQIDRIYSGEYDYVPDMGKNSPYAKASCQLSAISEQYRRGIEETIKAERTKMELVTNVSHDLKTPLTSIIGYIDLLSKEELSEEAAEHVRILQMKSERLKNIVSDVFELAKTTSGEIKIEKEPLDLTKLSYQTLAEMEDRIAQSGLTVKMNICEPPVTVISDGKRLYRVIQNLLDNALKYSLRGTRIYYTLEKQDARAYITIKNIAAYEMTFTKDEILERFTRGDKARSTEGTGLGLSIAQGFALACGGSFDIEIDGDMFKAMLSFPVEPDKKAKVTADG